MQENIVRFQCFFGHAREWSQYSVVNGETLVTDLLKEVDDVVRMVMEFCRPFSKHFRVDDRSSGLNRLFASLKDKQFRAFDVAFDEVGRNAKLCNHIIEGLDVGLDFGQTFDGH